MTRRRPIPKLPVPMSQVNALHPCSYASPVAIKGPPLLHTSLLCAGRPSFPLSSLTHSSVRAFLPHCRDGGIAPPPEASLPLCQCLLRPLPFAPLTVAAPSATA